jgi:LPS-assembly lipoprotein
VNRPGPPSNRAPSDCAPSDCAPSDRYPPHRYPSDRSSSDRAPSVGRRRLLCAAALPALLAAGCGFKLRGQTALPFKTFYAPLPTSSPFGGELRRALRTNGATIVERREDAQVRFLLLGELPEREIAALSTSGRPREYQLRYRLRWRALDALDQELIAPSEMVLRRQITVLDVQGIVNEEEVQLLYRDMRIDAIQQILRRLATLPPQPPLP